MSDQGDHRTRQQLELVRDAVGEFARDLVKHRPELRQVGFTLVVHARDLSNDWGYEVATSLPERDLMRAMLTDLVGDELVAEARERGLDGDALDQFCSDTAARDVEALAQRRGPGSDFS